MGENINAATLTVKFEGQAQQLEDTLKRVSQRVSETQKTVERVGGKTITTTRQTSQQFQQLGKETEKAQSPIRALLDGFGRFIPGAGRASASIKSTEDAVKKTQEAFPGLTGQMGAFGGAANKAGAAGSRFGAAMLGGAGPLIALGLVALVVGKVVEKFLQLAKAVVSAIFNFLRSTQVWQFARGILQDFIDFLLGKFLLAFAQSMQEGPEKARGPFAGFGDAVRQVAEKVAELAPKLIDLVLKMAPLVVKVVEIIGRFVDWISQGDRLEFILKVLLAVVVLVGGAILVFVAIVMVVIDKFRALRLSLDVAWQGFQQIGAAVAGFGHLLWDLANGAVQGFISLATTLWQILSGIGSYIAGGLSWAWQGLMGVLGGVWNFFSGMAATLQGVWDIVGGLGAALGGAFSWAWQGLSGILQTVAGFLQWVWDALVGIGNAIGGALGWVGEKGGEFLDWLNPFQEGGPVYSTGPALLHSGEFVLPAGTSQSIARLLQFYGGGGGGGSTSQSMNAQVVVNIGMGEDASLFGMGRDAGLQIAQQLRGFFG